MKILKGLPRSILDACLETEKRLPGSVGDVYVVHEGIHQADYRPEYHVNLRPGFCAPKTGTHLIRSVSEEDVISELQTVTACSCVDCEELNP